jgi:hypothetical protein
MMCSVRVARHWFRVATCRLTRWDCDSTSRLISEIVEVHLMRHILLVALSIVMALVMLSACSKSVDQPQGPVTRNDHGKARPECDRSHGGRVDAHSPELAEGMEAEWHEPVRLDGSINTTCPEDAIEISPDGEKLYFMFTEDLLDELGGAMLSFPNGTYVATRTGGPGEFSDPTFYELGWGGQLSLDGELSFSPDGSEVFFHSNRPENLGYQQGEEDFLDIYVASIHNGVPGVARNLGAPVNSVYPDGEACLHPDGVTLYFASLRPGPAGFPAGHANIWRSSFDGLAWSEPEFLPTTAPTVLINRPFTEQKQPVFTSDGDTMYFVSDHFPHGSAIYRSVVDSEGRFGPPELVIRGIVGEPSLTADGRYLYFVHVLSDAAGGFDADIWYVERKGL